MPTGNKTEMSNRLVGYISQESGRQLRIRDIYLGIISIWMDKAVGIAVII